MSGSRLTEIRSKNSAKLGWDIQLDILSHTWQTTMCIERQHLIFDYKNKYTYKFRILTIKNDSGNIPKSDEFKFENSLNLNSHYSHSSPLKYKAIRH